MHKTDFDRRDAIKSLLAITAASALAACTGSTENGGAKPAASASLKYASEGKFLNAAEMTLVAALAQTIIPKTDTAGAIEAGVPEAIQGLASEWGDDNHRKYVRTNLKNSVSLYWQNMMPMFLAAMSKTTSIVTLSPRLLRLIT